MSHPTGPFMRLRGRGEPLVFDEDEHFVAHQSSPNKVVNRSNRKRSEDGKFEEIKPSNSKRRQP